MREARPIRTRLDVIAQQRRDVYYSSRLTGAMSCMTSDDASFRSCVGAKEACGVGASCGAGW